MCREVCIHVRTYAIAHARTYGARVRACAYAWMNERCASVCAACCAPEAESGFLERGTTPICIRALVAGGPVPRRGTDSPVASSDGPLARGGWLRSSRNGRTPASRRRPTDSGNRLLRLSTNATGVGRRWNARTFGAATCARTAPTRRNRGRRSPRRATGRPRLGRGSRPRPRRGAGWFRELYRRTALDARRARGTELGRRRSRRGAGG